MYGNSVEFACIAWWST